ncbi:MAG: hypothetical protein IPJ84_12475 [Bdellovibrionales bacterium]|nr:hypothetical protein [Bdellovibrionales bacterium]
MISFLLRLSLVMFLSQLPTTTFGAELMETWTSVRALGMGNAFTAVAQEGDAIFITRRLWGESQVSTGRSWIRERE